MDVHSQLWMSVSGRIDFGARSALVADGSLRTADFVKQWKQQTIRVNYSCRIKKWEIGGGLMFSNAWNYNSPPAAVKEYRSFLHGEYKKLKSINLRARWEFRKFENSGSFFHRPRIQVRFTRAISDQKVERFVLVEGSPRPELRVTDSKPAWQLVASDEMMWQSRSLECFGYDQNRVYAGIKRNFHSCSVEAGYSLFYTRKSKDIFELDNVFLITLGF